MLAAQAGYTGAELLGRDGAVTVLVEEGEGLLELGDLLLGKLLVTRPGTAGLLRVRARGRQGEGPWMKARTAVHLLLIACVQSRAKN